MPNTVPVTVFLAEDSAIIRERVTAILAGSDINIVGQAGTPQDCIAGILAAHPNVVVLDIHLEGGTGAEVMRAVRPIEPEISFVVFTLDDSPAYRKRYLSEGAKSFLDKSTEFAQLTAAVMDACGPGA